MLCATHRGGDPMSADDREVEVRACLTVVITDLPYALVVDLFEAARRHNGTFEVQPPSTAETGAVDVHCSFNSDDEKRAFKQAAIGLAKPRSFLGR